jgi:hypothetical protein
MDKLAAILEHNHAKTLRVLMSKVLKNSLIMNQLMRELPLDITSLNKLLSSN